MSLNHEEKIGLAINNKVMDDFNEHINKFSDRVPEEQLKLIKEKIDSFKEKISPPVSPTHSENELVDMSEQRLANEWFEEYNHDITGNSWVKDNGWMSMCIAGGGEHACYVQSKRNLYTHEWEMRLNFPVRQEIKKIDCVYAISFECGCEGLVFEKPPQYCYDHNPDIYEMDWFELYEELYGSVGEEATPYDNVDIKNIIKESDISMVELHALQKLIVEKLKEGREKKVEDNKKKFKIGDKVKLYDSETEKLYGSGTLEGVKTKRCVVKLDNGGLARVPISFLADP